MKKIAILGSSGGNLYKQGGSDPQGMLKEIFAQAGSADISVRYIQLIGTASSMDGISMDVKARLYTLSGDSHVTESEESTLGEINQMAEQNDAELAELIRAGEIDGIMLMSCEPQGANHQALTAAAEKQIPIAGLLPIIVAAIAAKQISGMDEVGIVAGVVGGALATDGGIIGGVIVGILAGILVHSISTFCYRHRVPGTTANIAAGGLAGLVAGLIGMYAIAPAALQIGEGIKGAIDWALNVNAVLAGAIAGLAIWFAIIGGVYHAAILPIVLLEMEAAGSSFLGAIDLCGLVMVCAGIQLANIVKPRNPGDRASAVPNILVNLAFGTFVEAAYPFMFSSKKVFAGAVAASATAGILIGFLEVKCTAYVPCFAAPFMSNDRIFQTIICMAAAMGSAFIFTLAANAAEQS